MARRQGPNRTSVETVAGGETFEAVHAAATADLDQLVRRLRSLSPRAWESRRGPVQAALAGLVAITAELEGRPLEAPTVPDHVLADAIAVVGGDALSILKGSSDVERLVEVRELLERVLDQTR